MPPSGEEGAETTAASAAHQTSEAAFLAYRYRTPCPSSDGDCVAAHQCPIPQQRSWLLFALESKPGGTWVLIQGVCLGSSPPTGDVQVVVPQVTSSVVLNALRRIGLPALEVQIQPEHKTLVNFDTIFYAEPQTVTRDLTLLGQRVRVEATPSSYGWSFGDGTGASTAGPGAPYPAMDVVHKYLDAHVTVAPSVAVTYSARFRVGGGGWQDVDGTVTVDGPPASLRIAEAIAVLSGNHG